MPRHRKQKWLRWQVSTDLINTDLAECGYETNLAECGYKTNLTECRYETTVLMSAWTMRGAIAAPLTTGTTRGQTIPPSLTFPWEAEMFCGLASGDHAALVSDIGLAADIAPTQAGVTNPMTK